MAHSYSITEDVSYYTPYGHGAASFDPPSNTLRNSLIAAAAAFVFSGLAIAHGIGRLPSVDTLESTVSPASLAINDEAPRTPLETLPPEIATQAALQPVHVSATVTAPDIPAALYAAPEDSQASVSEDAYEPSDAAAPADSQAEDADAVVYDPEPEAPPEPQPADEM